MKIRLPSIMGVTGLDCPNAGSFAEFRVTGFSESLLQMSVVCRCSRVLSAGCFPQVCVLTGHRSWPFCLQGLSAHIWSFY